jgi:hypothetical protein
MDRRSRRNGGLSGKVRRRHTDTMMRPCLFGSALGASNAGAVEWSGGALPSGCALGCLLLKGFGAELHHYAVERGNSCQCYQRQRAMVAGQLITGCERDAM